MPLHLLDDNDLWFPDVSEAMEDGLLAVGGSLTTERLLLAYGSGIFPWFGDDDPPMWWCPDPRFVLFPAELKVSKSMKQVVRNGGFELRVNTAFDEVLARCSEVERKGQDGTWIVDEIKGAYGELHRLGYAHSAEAWHDGELVGGLYGVMLGKVFFGESMFSLKTNASKFAFVQWVELLSAQGVALIDCQVYTPHLESLGARMIPRSQFLALLNKHLPHH